MTLHLDWSPVEIRQDLDDFANQHTLWVDPASAGERLDRWLAAQPDLADVSRSRIQKLIDQGCVWLNDQSCRIRKQPLQPGDQIYLKIPDPVEIGLQPEPIPLEILYEDPHLILINKPKGMVVHPAPGHPSGTLVNALLAHCQDLSGINGQTRPGIVHRLDKDTSGVMVVAKTDQAHHQLQAQIQAKTARREYLGLVYGRPQDPAGTVDTHLGRHPVDRLRMAVVDPRLGRRAITHWQVLEALGNFTWMGFELETGRTHQIRVHAAHIRHPIVGDPLYCSGSSTPVKLSGQALHAHRLSLLHPVSGEPLVATAPLPQELGRLLRVLGSRWLASTPKLSHCLNQELESGA